VTIWRLRREGAAAIDPRLVSPFIVSIETVSRCFKGARLGKVVTFFSQSIKLLDMVQLRWRHLDGAQLLPLVRAGVKFADGVQVDPSKPVTQSTDNQPREAA
jgi:hypothetical protein